MWTDPRFMVTVIVLGIAGVYDFAVTILLMHDNVSQIEMAIMSVIVGALNAGGFTVAVQFWLGSSHSSQNKDDTVKAQAATIASQAEALKK